jgi:hypothetical protein
LSLYGGEQSDGKLAYTRMLTGWRTHTQIWPTLMNRALKYRIKIPRVMMTDPERKWPTYYGLVDLSVIYAQGGSNPRFIPNLADVLRFWGYDNSEAHPLPEDVLAAVCVDPVGTARLVEPYLSDMAAVMRAYYPIAESVIDEKLVGLAVPCTPTFGQSVTTEYH